MLLSTLASCGSCVGSFEDETTQGTAGTATESGSESSSNETQSETETQPGEESSTPGEDSTSPVEDVPVEHPVPDVDNGEVIANANNLWAGVNAYYESGTRKDFTIENQNTSLTIHAAPDGNAMVGSIQNNNGVSYIENTMDVFVKMGNGKTFYASASQNPITFDLYRFGMYYYELRAQKQNFINQYNVYAEKNLDVENNPPRAYYEMSKPTLKDGAVTTTMLDKNDPKIYYNHAPFSTNDYNFIAVDVRVTSPDMSYMRSLSLFVFDNDNNHYSTSHAVANDGEFHTYYFKLDEWSKFSDNTIKEFRFDFGGIIGDVLEYKNVRAVKADTDGSPDIRLCRYIHMFSDKTQQVIQISAVKDTAGIEEIGVVTNLDKSRVNAIIVKDKNGTHDTLDGVDWDSVEYVGFDIKDAGIFGYILLPDGDLALMGNTRCNDTSSGKIVITEKGGKYVIVQSRAPKDNSLKKPTATNDPDIDDYVENYDNCADFYMGHRIYTDENHDFAEFIKAAETERNPVKAENIVVDTENSTGAEYLGYDALRGMYVFKVDGSNFNKPYYEEPNKHFNVKFTVKGDDRDRNMYIMTTTAHGELQSAAILDANSLLLPIPVEVGKNFSDGGQNYFDAIDDPWSEAYFPMYIKAGEEKTFNFLNLYMNWGRMPLKQISFIQLAPLYHLSTGVTETNCLLPWYSNMGSTRNIWTIPDHRPMSAPFWTTQPNHTSGGDHRFLRYTDADGNYYATEVTRNYITSYGPTYAQVVFEHLSDDGKIKVKYTHMEMPQTDENRAYYTMEYTVLEDVSFKDFKNDFAFYSMNAYNGVNYQRIGYLNEKNQCSVMPVDTKEGRTRFFTLGDYFPYFSFYRDDKCTLERGYINLSFLIKDAEFNLQGVQNTPNFAIKTLDKHIYLTLNLEEVTLKKGDTVKINAIIMPWGSQETPYDQVINEETGEKYEDKNVRDVRENTIIKPLTVVANNACEVVENEWLPEVRLTNGVIGGFTVKGASNNSTILVSGVTKLCIPQLSEKITKDTGSYWVRYNLSSYHYADKNGNGQAYDGYGVQYNPDGTYTYSFVLDMSKGEDREFKISFSDNFVEEPVPEFDPNNTEYGEAGIVEGPNYMMDAQALYKGANKTSASSGMEKTSTVMRDSDGTEYFRFYATNGKSEAWIMPFTVPATPIKTGKYLIIKYRLPETNTNVTRFEIWTSTFYSTPSKEAGAISYAKDNLTNDNQWRILVIDLSRMSSIKFEAAPNGDYYANFLRFDFFEKHDDNSYIDVAYIAFDDRAEDIFAYPQNKGFDSVTFYDGRVLDVATTETEFPAPKVVYEDDTATYETPFNVYLSAGKLAHLGSKTNEFGYVTYFEDEGYVRFNSHISLNESDFVVYRGEEGKETGRYLVIKYRASITQDNYLQFYASTIVGKQSFGDDKGATSLSQTNFVRNGLWQIAVIDLSTMTKEYTADADGKFSATLLRFDPFNGKQGTTAEYVDVAYIALCDDFKTAVTYGYDESVPAALARLGADNTKYYSTETGEIFTGTLPTPPADGGDTPNAGKELYFNINSLGGNAAGKRFDTPLLFETGHEYYPVAGYIATNAKGTLYLSGWIGTINESDGIVFRVIGENGATLTDWTALVNEINSGNNQAYPTFYAADATVSGIVASMVTDGYAYGFRGYADLTAYKDQTVTVEFALVLKSDEEEKQYFTFITAKGVKVSVTESSEPEVQSKPVYFNAQFSNSVGKVCDGKPLICDGITTSTGDKAGMLYFYGWGGTIGEVEFDAETSTGGVKYRVLDSNGEVLEDWQYLSVPYVGSAGNEYPICVANTENLATVQSKVSGATHAYTVRGYIDLTEYSGGSVTVEIAFTMKDAPAGEELFTFLTVKNVQVAESNGSTPDGTEPGEGETQSKPVYFNATFSNGVNKVCDKKPLVLDGGVTTSAGKGGKLYFYGWGGTLGEVDFDAETSTGGVKYRVLGANGEVLDDWQYLDQYDTYPICIANTENLAAVQKNVPDATHAYTVRGWIDLTAYKDSSVTLEIAFTMKDAPAGQELFTFITINNLQVVD